MKIVHITFEKLTGLKGTIDGWFKCDPNAVDSKLPIVFITVCDLGITFRQNGKLLGFDFAGGKSIAERDNYAKHFRYGSNFLIKEISDSGARSVSQNPN